VRYGPAAAQSFRGLERGAGPGAAPIERRDTKLISLARRRLARQPSGSPAAPPQAAALNKQGQRASCVRELRAAATHYGPGERSGLQRAASGREGGESGPSVIARWPPPPPLARCSSASAKFALNLSGWTLRLAARWPAQAKRTTSCAPLAWRRRRRRRQTSSPKGLGRSLCREASSASQAQCLWPDNGGGRSALAARPRSGWR